MSTLTQAQIDYLYAQQQRVNSRPSPTPEPASTTPERNKSVSVDSGASSGTITGRTNTGQPASIDVVVPPTIVSPSPSPVYTVQKEAFPSDVAPYNFQVMFAEYNPELALHGRTDVKHDLMITLPIPANLMSVTGLDYASMELGAFGGEAAKAMEQIVNSGNPIGALNELIRRAASGDSYFKEALPVLIRRVVSGISPTVGGVVDLIRGDTPNPHVAVTFNSVKLRTFTYSWRLSPSSKAESEQLHKIIKILHSRILPGKQSAFTLSYPNQCLIQIQPDPLNELFAFKPAVVTDMSVNYAPSGIPSFFRDNMPTEVELSLSFQEIQIRTSGDYAAFQGDF